MIKYNDAERSGLEADELWYCSLNDLFLVSVKGEIKNTVERKHKKGSWQGLQDDQNVARSLRLIGEQDATFRMAWTLIIESHLYLGLYRGR